MNPYLYVLLITVLPAIELRGSIPVGIGMGAGILPVFILATVANVLIIFPIFLFLDKFFPYFQKKVGFVDKIIASVRTKTEKYVQKYGTLGLLLFVAVPLPGSGAYSGCLAAYLLNIPRKSAVPAIAGGVIVAGILVTLASAGVVAGLRFFL